VVLAKVIGAGIDRGACGSRARATRAAAIAALALALLGALPAVAQAEASEEPEFSCTSVTLRYTGFPNLPGNTATEKIRLDGTQYSLTKFTFDGPTGTDVVPVLMSPGHHSVDAFAKWDTNGVKGSRDKALKGGITCEANPRFSIGKLQEVIGEDTGGSGFTASQLTAAVGQTVRYEIIVTNTGNVPLTFGALTDARCDEGTLTGGPGEAEVAPRELAVYFCEHVITLADLGGPTYTNAVATSATSAEGEEQSTTVNAFSNTVVVNLLSEPPAKEPPPKEPPPGNKEGENTTQGAGPDQSSQISGATAQQGVLAVVAAALPAPVFNQSANLFRVAGTVLIKLPGGKRFLRLRAGTSVPIGTIIDATRGRAMLTTAADTASHTQETGTFYGGVFRLGQTATSGGATGNALTVLKLVGPLPSCLVKKFGKKAATSAAKRRTRKLWGEAKGNFRTVGRYAAATVRGTKWLTEDKCTGTLIRVVQHTVTVDAFPHKRHFLLGQGRSFIAHP
jgi:hypothetical protein